MKSNQLFATFLKACGVEPRFRKQGEVYKTYSIPQKFIFDPVHAVVTYLKPITKLVGGRYEHETEWQRFKIEYVNEQLNIARVA